MKLLKLTQYRPGGDTSDIIYVNIKEILYIKSSEATYHVNVNTMTSVDVTILKISSGLELLVRESITEIFEKIEQLNCGLINGKLFA